MHPADTPGRGFYSFSSGRTPYKARSAWAAHYDLVNTGSSWLNGSIHLQDTDSLAELEIEEIILALFAVRRLDLVSCPVFYAN